LPPPHVVECCRPCIQTARSGVLGDKLKKRYTVLGLSLFLALALSVPALGGPSNPVATVSASVKSIAKKALKKAKAAQTAADNAQNTANSASSAAANAQKDATAAQKSANGAQGTANTALSTANAAKTAAASAQSAADNALNVANGKMSGEVQVEGEEGTTFGVAGCPSGKVPTGGGFIITGADNNAATVTESTQYGTAWIVFAKQIKGTTGSSWGTVATVNCATSP
jgi:membrane protein involved in colicin uptake